MLLSVDCSSNCPEKLSPQIVSAFVVQMFGQAHQAGYHQSQGTMQWPNGQTSYGTIGHPVQSLPNPCIGTPVPPSTTYNNELTYAAQQRDPHYKGTNSDHLLMRNPPHRPPFNSQPGHHSGVPFNTGNQFDRQGPENTQPRHQTTSHQLQDAEGQFTRDLLPTRFQGACGAQRQQPAFGDARATRGAFSNGREARSATTALSTSRRQQQAHIQPQAQVR